MGELKHIGEGMKSTVFTPESYKERKQFWLSTIDENSEYVVVDKIYCKHCGAKKSLDMPERYFYTKCSCDCENRRKADEERSKARLARAREYAEINNKMLPAEVRGAAFHRIVDSRSSEHYITVCERCEKFCRNFQAVKESGRGIWLYGGFDTGKTYLAAAILKALQEEGVTCLFTTMEMVFEELKSTYNSNGPTTEKVIMARYSDVECLILDGFTGIKSSRKGADNWAADKFCEIMKRRFNQHRPTVVTCRETIKELVVGGLLPREIVDKLINKMVQLPLTELQRRATQQAIEF